MEPLVSIIMPCYNAEKYISQAIESVRNQTYSNWELIIVNDCSKDNSVEIISKYIEVDSRIHFYSTDKPSGSPVEPRNIAIKKAAGCFIAFLDSDDLWLPTKLEHQIPLLCNEDTAIVFSNYEKINMQGLRENRVIKAPSITNYNNLLKGCVIGNLTGMYDVRKVGKIYCEKVHHEDYLLWLTILKKGFVARNTNTLEALYRVCNNSVSANKFKTIKWQWNILYNVERLPLIRAIYCFINYAVKGFLKSLK